MAIGRVSVILVTIGRMAAFAIGLMPIGRMSFVWFLLESSAFGALGFFAIRFVAIGLMTIGGVSAFAIRFVAKGVSFAIRLMTIGRVAALTIRFMPIGGMALPIRLMPIGRVSFVWFLFKRCSFGSFGLFAIWLMTIGVTISIGLMPIGRVSAFAIRLVAKGVSFAIMMVSAMTIRRVSIRRMTIGTMPIATMLIRRFALASRGGFIIS